ncbi:MAG: C1 family peptidase, partial [Planctomycetota bacterium]
MKPSWLITTPLILMIISLPPGMATTSQKKAVGEIGISTLSKTAEALQSAHFRTMQEEFDSKPHNKYMQNAVTVTTINKLALNRAVVTGIDNSFSCKLDDWAVTNQKNSGRCWIFAGTNLLRVGAMKKMNLKEFEFSQ